MLSCGFSFLKGKMELGIRVLVSLITAAIEKLRSHLFFSTSLPFPVRIKTLTARGSNQGFLAKGSALERETWDSCFNPREEEIVFLFCWLYSFHWPAAASGLWLWQCSGESSNVAFPKMTFKGCMSNWYIAF